MLGVRTAVPLVELLGSGGRSVREIAPPADIDRLFRGICGLLRMLASYSRSARYAGDLSSARRRCRSSSALSDPGVGDVRCVFDWRRKTRLNDKDRG